MIGSPTLLTIRNSGVPAELWFLAGDGEVAKSIRAFSWSKA
jgi:hypothetical protein